MKKFIMLSALVAATSTAFVACSSEDDLAQQPKAPETTVDEGTPLTIQVVDATRGTDWTGTTLPSFSLYCINTITKARGMGSSYSDGKSTGLIFTGDYNGNFTNADAIWEDGTWDFYALSNNKENKLVFYEESDGGTGKQDAEHLNEETPENRNFSYTVPANYNDQTDLLVGAAMGLSKSNNGGVVTIPFQHALAQIGQITLKFDATSNTEDNNSKIFLIKSITLHGIKSTGTYTFPATWEADAGHYNLNNVGTWTTVDGSETAYHLELPQFDLDAYNNYKIFDETKDDEDAPTPSEFTANNFATGTERGGLATLPNFFRCPAHGENLSYTFPLAKKTGTEGNTQYYYNPTAPTYSVDGGLYIIPQVLNETVFTKNSGDVDLTATTGVYAEIQGLLFVEASDFPGGPYRVGDPSDQDYNDFAISADFWGGGIWDDLLPLNNARLTQCLNHADNLCTFQVPLTRTTKKLEAGKVYNLTFDLSQAVTVDLPGGVFAGVTIKDN